MNVCRITVLMAIYNCADTLVEALDSMYNQTYRGFKIVLCDDASTDNTYEVAKKYAEKHDNIILIRNDKNLKLSASLNRCIAFADTEYVARMDGDDISLPERFQEEIKVLDEHPEFSIVSCGQIFFDENGIWGMEPKEEAEPTFSSFRKGTPHSHPPAMMRTKELKEIGGYTVSPQTVRGQDYDLWYKFYKAGYRGYNLPISYHLMRLDSKAFKRRTLKYRFLFFQLKWRVLKGLKQPYPLLGAFPELIKAFIPNVIMSKMLKKRMKRLNTIPFEEENDRENVSRVEVLER